MVVIDGHSHLSDASAEPAGRLDLVELPEGDHDRGVAVGRFPITEAEYGEFVDDTDRPPPSHWRGDRPPDFIARHPVTNVTWVDAVACCRWLSERLGTEVGLPTGEEWLRAAGGAGRPFPWGDEFDPSRCNTWESGWGRTMPVDAFRGGVSPHGVWDLCGNVWEWTADSASIPGWKMLRGGSWYDTGHGVSVWRTLEADARRSSPNTGFRIVVRQDV